MCDLILVVGSQNSSNSTRLKEIAQKKGVPAYLIDNASEIKEDWLQGVSRIGVTAGASAPEVLVEEVVNRLKSLGNAIVTNASGIEEKVVFSLPRELEDKTVEETLVSWDSIIPRPSDLIL